MMDGILHEIFVAIATAAASAITAWAVQQARRNGIEITAAQQELMKKYEAEAILYAEEKAAQWLKDHGTKMASSTKLQLAIDYLKTHSKFHANLNSAEVAQRVQAGLKDSNLGASIGLSR